MPVDNSSVSSALITYTGKQPFGRQPDRECPKKMVLTCKRGSFQFHYSWGHSFTVVRTHEGGGGVKQMSTNAYKEEGG